MKRKEKEAFWLNRINEYRESGKSLKQSCTDSDITIYSMNYWLRKQSPVAKMADQETTWVSCIVEDQAIH